MRASLVIGDIQVELVVPAGQLERVVAERYSPFLGAVEAPARSLIMCAEPSFDSGKHLVEAVVDREPGGMYRVIHPGFRVLLDPKGASSLHCAPTVGAIDHALRTVFALLAPIHDALLLEASGVIDHGGAHIFIWPPAPGYPTIDALAGSRPVLTDAYVMLHQASDGTWLAAATPFWSSKNRPGVPREAGLDQIWMLRDETVPGPYPVDARITLKFLMDKAVVPGADEATRLVVLDLAMDIASAVPLSVLATPVANKRPQFA